MVGLCMILAFSLMVVQSVLLFKIEDWEKKSTDYVGPMFAILSGLTNVAVALGFGKPYTPMYFSGVGLAVSLFVCWKYPGLRGSTKVSSKFRVYNI